MLHTQFCLALNSLVVVWLLALLYQTIVDNSLSMEQQHDKYYELRMAQQRRDIAWSWFIRDTSDARAMAAVHRASRECLEIAGRMLREAEEDDRENTRALQESEAKLAAEFAKRRTEP